MNALPRRLSQYTMAEDENCYAMNWAVVGCMPPGLAPFPPPPGAGCVDHPSAAPCRTDILLNESLTCRKGDKAKTRPLGRRPDGTDGPEGPPGLIWTYGAPPPLALWYNPRSERLSSREALTLHLILSVTRAMAVGVPIGNYGTILSRGLMDAITEEQWRECERCEGAHSPSALPFFYKEDVPLVGTEAGPH